MKYPFISLVVVNYNGEKIIKMCLDSLLKVDYPNYEVIVVDNASKDSSVSMIKKFKKVRLIQNKKNEGYVGVNSSLSKVKGEYIFVLNNDLEMDKNCLKEIASAFSDDVGIVVPRIVNFYDRKLKSSGTWLSRAFYNGHYIDPDEKMETKEIPYLGVEVVKTSIAKKFGYIYDPDYFVYAEDIDVSLRFRMIGYKTLMAPKALIYHMHSVTTMKSGAFSTYLMERNLLTTFFKVFSVGNLLLFFPYVFGMRLIALLKDLVTLNFSMLFARLKAIFWILFNFGKVLKKRGKLQKMRTKNDNYLLEVFSEKYLFKKKVLL